VSLKVYDFKARSKEGKKRIPPPPSPRPKNNNNKKQTGKKKAENEGFFATSKRVQIWLEIKK